MNTNAPKYYVAKYLPDIQRLEPRNIGVLVWSPAGVEARFLGEKSERLGEVDGRSIPSFVTSPSAYRQWIRFWRNELGKDEIESAANWTQVSRSSPEFLDALGSWNRGNFVLVEGGFLLDRVDEDELPRVADQLFGLLVDGGGPDDPRDPTLDEMCEQVIRESQMDTDSSFIMGPEVECPISEETTERFEFSYGYRNGRLQRLYQKVPLSRRKTVLRKTVHDCAWMFDKVIQSRLIRREQGAVLVYVTDEQKPDPEIDRSLRVLCSVTRVLNLRDQDRVREEFASLRSLALHR